MKCPHCETELTYRQRGGRRCGSCKRAFALEPRTNPFKLHDLRLKQLDAKLSAGGSLAYSSEQLRYAAAGKALASQRPPTVLGCAMILAIVAGIIASIVTEEILIGIVLAVVVVGLGLIVRALFGNRIGYPQVPLDPARFERDVLKRFHEVYLQMPPGLIDTALRARINRRLPAAADLRGAIVCPEPAVRECLLANGVQTTFGLAVLPAGGPFTPDEQAHLDVLRNRADLPLLLLHDASPSGCLLADQVAAALGLPGDRRVLDLGLRPQTAIKRSLLVIGAKPDPQQIAMLRRKAQLEAAEIAWLESGKITPILAVPPARLVQLIKRATERIAARRPAITQTNTPQQLAGAVGFMSWPE
ncbi:MAG: hypothetical protein HC822_12240 [Oscillochloris sp.]|nr:hypothetical protein [Oscillochloris sp.]